MKTVLVTGGAGYIGSHVVKVLGEQGYKILVYDNLSTGHEWAVLYGRLIRGDILDYDLLSTVFETHKIDAVVHLAAHILVPESVEQPLKYYWNNVTGTLNLLRAMKKYRVNKLIFSSTAAVYGIPFAIHVKEDDDIRSINPYGRSKAMVEQALKDLSDSSDFKYVILRYFNVAGADSAGSIGEGKEDATHLITMCVRTAAGKRPQLDIYGIDYPTRDGSCVRDYIYVGDLAQAHILSLEYLINGGKSRIYNCGYGHGYSVLEVVEVARKVTGVDFPVLRLNRRFGDPPELVADASRLKEELKWQAEHDDLHYIIDTAWRWELKNIESRNHVI